MPELPEVETVMRGLAVPMTGARLEKVTCYRKDLRFPLPRGFAKKLTGREVLGLRRRAKYLLVDLQGDTTLIAHLGMSGRFVIHGAPAPLEPHTHVRFQLHGGTDIHYCDPRRFGFMDLAPTESLETHKFFAAMGPEPLGNAFSGPHLREALRAKKTPIKSALLDQHVVAGLGNIYVCEALYRAGISPRRSAHTIGPARAERLVPEIKKVLGEAIAAGGSSLKDYAQANGELGYFQHAFQVYGREGAPCLKQGCHGTVQRIVQSGRSTFFCSSCQR
ncbi:MAG: bifunctional DNA-formamidopyrimidine glycosylase/DNA-(apurinic or apyrimidinic site) lyase [Alphaproteobacteria bacterium]|nr:MAG: bifunctional DNA-formamidopyrimidine glycosylase/DNA-(apurinic or apyrimidinic site) lyase [Alphaproteobacteria bacterium]